MEELILKYKEENDSNHRSWSRICAIMGSGFQLLNETNETRLQMVTEWMERNQKTQAAKSIAKQIKFEAEIGEATKHFVIQIQEKDLKLKEI